MLKRPMVALVRSEAPMTNGIIPDTFWRMNGVFRSLDPTHAVSAWGHDARDYVKDHHKVITMGERSPIHRLEQQGGKIILIAGAPKGQIAWEHPQVGLSGGVAHTLYLNPDTDRLEPFDEERFAQYAAFARHLSGWPVCGHLDCLSSRTAPRRHCTR